ncbi:MAG TPA: N-acetyl-D-Glu racemase DgcA [Hyphomicrobiaceae bacterium]|nr:N-acetyl-D-Glu racemase DgcA [Hyphomicrobiaceae bacterium]
MAVRIEAIDVESWPVAGEFVISRGTRRQTDVVVVHLVEGRHRGRGECVPYARYGETIASAVAAIREAQGPLDRVRLQGALPAGAARNALDCALWDLDASRHGTSAAALAGLPALRPVLTCYTLSLAAPQAMADQAAALPRQPLLKLKLGAPQDAERMRAVRARRPDARLIADVNEGWTPDMMGALLEVAAECGIELVEQPLPAGHDSVLASTKRPVPVCADESVHTSADLSALRDRYDAVNIKLDKAGGLTEALTMAREARRLGFRIMAGSMLATSLSMAPALILAQHADWVDLDSPLLLARDRIPGLSIVEGWIAPPPPGLWGSSLP